MNKSTNITSKPRIRRTNIQLRNPIATLTTDTTTTLAANVDTQTQNNEQQLALLPPPSSLLTTSVTSSSLTEIVENEEINGTNTTNDNNVNLNIANINNDNNNELVVIDIEKDNQSCLIDLTKENDDHNYASDIAVIHEVKKNRIRNQNKHFRGNNNNNNCDATIVIDDDKNDNEIISLPPVNTNSNNNNNSNPTIVIHISGDSLSRHEAANRVRTRLNDNSSSSSSSSSSSTLLSSSSSTPSSLITSIPSNDLASQMYNNNNNNNNNSNSICHHHHYHHSTQPHKRQRLAINSYRTNLNQNTNDNNNATNSTINNKNNNNNNDNNKKTELCCPICLETLDEIKSHNKTLMVTFCGHIMCNMCVDQHFKANQAMHNKNITCPTCRTKIARNKIHDSKKKMKEKSLKNFNIDVEAIKLNEKFFENCIDLIPARIYLNADDRKQWFRLLDKEIGNDADDEEDDDEDNDDADDNEIETDANNYQIKHSRFDPIYYKTVSQLYKELEKCKKLNKPLNFNNFKKVQHQKSKLDRTSDDDDDDENEENRKKIKLENKNQSSGSGGGGGNSNGDNKKNKDKKLSKKQQDKKEKRKLEKNLELTQSSGDDNTPAAASTQKKPILNQNGQIVYSKFDFSVETGGRNSAKGGKANKKNSKISPNSNVKPKDYKILVKNLQEKKEKLTKLKESEPEKAFEIETNSKWKTAIDKASGIKVKDDVDLLKKSIKRIEKKKEKSKKEWTERVQKVEHSRQKTQEKRMKNIEIRKEKKREKKVKRLKKKVVCCLDFSQSK